MSAGDRETTAIARTTVRIVVPLILVTAVALLLQGHNRPGGGFIAGVLTCTAVALTYVVFGRAYLEREILDRSPTGVGTLSGVTRSYADTFAVGLAIALGGGLGAVALGTPFLTQGVLFLEGVPLYGDFEIATAFVFDLGVYLVVVGGLLTVLAVVGSE